MKMTIEQRIGAMERELAIIQSTVKLLHKMLKEQRELISEYIANKIAVRTTDENGNGDRPTEAIYTFVCKQRFDKLDNDIRKMRKLVEDMKYPQTVG